MILESQPRPILLLGAGASVTSGVPLVRDLTEMIGRQAYCWMHERDFRDPTLVRSDWLPWVQGLAWYDETLGLAELYGLHIERLLNPRERRRRFFQEHVLVNPESASSGYVSLASLVGKRRVHTMLTTNFDTLAYDSCRRDPTASSVVQVQDPDHADLISTDPGVSQVVHVHGVIDHYTDLNLTSEVASIDQRYRSRLVPLIADHPLIVVGYRGAEPSVMNDLLLAAAEVSRANLPHGVYWCHRERDGDLSELVLELADRCEGNFATVPIDGFDELMHDLDEGTTRARIPAARELGSAFDGEPSSSYFPEDCDASRVDEVLADEALARLALEPAEDGTTRSRLEQLALLVESSDGAAELTVAGRALFGTDEPLRVVGHADGQSFQLVGNVFELYNEVTAIVEEHNAPYRLKGAESVDVRPYPPLAVKEILMNALGHRSLQVDEPIEISITPSRLRISNPGGLLDPAAAATLGEVPFKQYRNPAVAEVLYAAGLMDKYGSGLVDVRRWAAEGGAVATFEIGGDNTTFTATVTSRPDSRDQVGTTLAPGAYEVFYLNALEVELPEVAWVGPATARSPRDIFEASRGERVPPFVLNASAIITLSDLSDPSNPLSRHVDGSEAHAVTDLCREVAHERNIVELLNRSMQRHLEAAGLQVWMKKRRAWYPTDGEDERPIHYQARTRQAERTVVRLKNKGAKYPYYEHQAMNWSFVRTSGGWFLTIEPTWVFTQDGEFRRVGRNRTLRLSTKKMSNERNQSVVNHLFFWAWVLCGESASVSLDDGGGQVVVRRELLSRHIQGVPHLVGTGEDDEPDPDDLEDEVARDDDDHDDGVEDFDEDEDEDDDVED